MTLKLQIQKEEAKIVEQLTKNIPTNKHLDSILVVKMMRQHDLPDFAVRQLPESAPLKKEREKKKRKKEREKEREKERKKERKNAMIRTF